jgi:hypothetical protein
MNGTIESDTNGNTTPAAQPLDVNSYYGLYASLGTEYAPQTYTDSSGVSVTVSGGGYSPTSPSEPTARNPVYITYTDTNGNTQQIVIRYKIHNILPDAFQVTTADPQYPLTNFTYIAGLVDSVTYPDGSTYHFTYQTSSYFTSVADGQLASMELPTGGTITYQNTWSSQSCNYTGFGNASMGYLSQLVRTTSDGATTYGRTINSSAYGGTSACPSATSSTTHVSHPDNSSETISFVGIPEVLPTVPVGSGDDFIYHNIETAHSWYSASNILMKSTMKCYNGNEVL